MRKRREWSANGWIAAVFSAVLIITFAADPTLSAGTYWDFGNGLGFAAMAGLVCLGLLGPQVCGIKPHQWMAYITVLMILLHALWFLLGDSISLQYVLPGAPFSMWAGLLALVASLFLLVVALPSLRYRAHRQHRAFRHWHLGLSIAVALAALYHIIGSGLYIRSWLQTIVLAAVIAISFLWAPHVRANSLSQLRTVAVFITAAALCALLFTGVRGIAP